MNKYNRNNVKIVMTFGAVLKTNIMSDYETAVDIIRFH